MSHATPEYAEIVREALESYGQSLHVALPGIVQSYDASTQTATVLPAVRRALSDGEGGVVFEDYDPIQNVPVAFPGGHSFSAHWPLQKGDIVDLVWQDWSIAAWRQRGDVSDCGDARKNGPSYPVAYPWYRPSGGPGPDTDASMGVPGGLRVHYGPSAISVGEGADFVALAAKVMSNFSVIQTAALALASAVNASPGPVLGAVLGPLLSTFAAKLTPAPVASSDLKAD